MTDRNLLTLEYDAGFKALFQFAPIGILIMSREGQIRLVNPCLEKLLDYKNAELSGQAVETIIPGIFQTKKVHYHDEYFFRSRAKTIQTERDVFAWRKDGTEVPVQISSGKYLMEGEILTVAYITDITQRKRWQDELEAKVNERTVELKQSLVRERELNEMKSRFVSMASHEFRTPLSTILSSVSLIELYNMESQEINRKKHVERIKSSIKNLTAILNNFLSLDKLEQGQIETSREAFNLPEFARDIIEEIQGLLKYGQQIILRYHGRKEIFQDKKILRNIILNLLSNAIKYSQEDKSIELLIQVKKDLVSISVKDDGIGIPTEEQKNLFRTFYRARNVNNIQGTGLGLNIVKRYVELLNGTINFISKPGEGTIFTIELPQKPNIHGSSITN